MIQRRISFLTAYQNAAYARRYAGVVERVRAALPETIRGFGHVTEKSIEAARHRQAELLEELRRTERPNAKVA